MTDVTTFKVSDKPVSEGISLPAVRAWLECPVEEVMTDTLVFGDPELSLRLAAETMMDNGVGSLVLLGPDGPTSIVTERDLAWAIARKLDLDAEPATSIASSNLLSLRPGDTVQEAIARMSSCGVHHLPVKRHDELVGMVGAATDLLFVLACVCRA